MNARAGSLRFQWPWETFFDQQTEDTESEDESSDLLDVSFEELSDE